MKQEVRVYHQVTVTIVTKQWQLLYLASSPSCSWARKQAQVHIHILRTHTFSFSFTCFSHTCKHVCAASSRTQWAAQKVYRIMVFEWQCCPFHVAFTESCPCGNSQCFLRGWLTLKIRPPSPNSVPSHSPSLFFFISPCFRPLFLYHFLSLTPSPATPRLLNVSENLPQKILESSLDSCRAQLGDITHPPAGANSWFHVWMWKLKNRNMWHAQSPHAKKIITD